jgi:hypothetical protein
MDVVLMIAATLALWAMIPVLSRRYNRRVHMDGWSERRAIRTEVIESIVCVCVYIWVIHAIIH